MCMWPTKALFRYLRYFVISNFKIIIKLKKDLDEQKDLDEKKIWMNIEQKTVLSTDISLTFWA